MTPIPAPVVSLANAALSGALTLSRPADWREGTRRAFVWAPGAAVAGWMLWGSGRIRKAAGETSGQAAPAAGAAEPDAAGQGAADGPTPAQPASADSSTGGGTRKAARPRWGIRLAVSLTAGSITSAFMWISLRADAGLEDWISRRGVRHPRRWMAAGTALTSLALDAATNARESMNAKPESGRPA